MSVLFANETVKQVVHIAQSLARENYNSDYSAPHLLRALMHKDIGLQDFLKSIDKDPGYFMEWAEVRIEAIDKNVTLPDDIETGADIDLIMEEADEMRMRLGIDEVTPLCILAAVVKPNVAFTTEQLRSLPLREHEVLAVFRKENGNGLHAAGSNTFFETDGAMPPASFPALQKYCIDKTALAAQGKTDPIIGREKEIRALIEILGRRNKPNVIITGEPGVGKSALADGFAYEIIKGNVPMHLQNAVLLELDLGVLMAGASYKGEVEDRLKKIINELKSLDKAILFIDEIHVLTDAKGSMGAGAANLLKPELARGGITVIGATTQEEYRKNIEPEQAFNRRFELLPVTEPDFEACCKMVALLGERYEQHHHISVEKDAIPECVRLAKRYVKDKKLPDAALDLLDRTMSAIRMLDETSVKEIDAWKKQYAEAVQLQYESEKEKAAELKWLYSLLQNMVSPVLWGSMQEQPDISALENPEEITKIIGRSIEELSAHAAVKKESVGKAELAAVTAAKMNIPIGKIQAQEKGKLLNMEAYLLQRVIGQDHALKSLSDAIVESRSGINKPGRPIGSFFLLGPTGTGKTELAKSVAELLFNDEKAMIRFDMSEFKEEHSAALLYGAPPGYVGYEEGGVLVNKIRQQPYAVVLFDEIEKAHPSVFDVFLQIMDEGRISDKLGKEGDFSNALVLFTSNVGSEKITQKFEEHKIPSTAELMEIMSGKFRPEFLARLTEIVPFAPVTEQMAEKIFLIQLKALSDPLKRLGIALNISADAVKQLATAGFSSKYGARQISGVIRSQLSRPVSKMIVREEVKKADVICVTLSEDKTLVWEVKINSEHV